MVRGLGEDNAIAFIVIMIERLNNSIKVGNKMDEDDIIEASAIIANEYGTLKVEQLAQFCHLVKTGKLGEFIRFGMTTMFEALNKYIADTDEMIVQNYIDNKEIDHDRPKRGNAEKLGTLLSREDLNQLEKGKNNE